MYLLLKWKVRATLLMASTMLVVLSGCSETGGDATAMVEQARQFLNEGKTRHAMIKLKESIQEDPDNAEARFLLAKIYLLQGQASNAEIEINKAIKLGVKREQWVPVLGRALLLQSRFDAVINEFKEEAQDKDAVKAEIALMKGDAFLARKEWQSARKQFSQALLYVPAMLGPVYGMARVSLGEQDYVRALEYLDKVLSKDAQHFAAIIKKGDVFLQGGDKIQALALYDRAVNVLPEAQESRLKRAYLLIGLGRFDDAQQDINVVLQHNPRVPLAHYLNARVFFSQGNIDRASDALQEVFSLQPDYQPAQLLNAIVAISKARYRLAETSLERQLVAHATHLLSIKLLALTNLHLGNAEKVIERLADKSAKLRLDREALAIVGVAALRTGDNKKGEGALKAAFVLRSSASAKDSSDAVDNNIDDSQEKKIFDQFFLQVMNDQVKDLLKAAKPAPINFYHAGLIRMSLGEADVARDHFKEAITRGFDVAVANTALAQLAIRERQWDKAINLMGVVLDKTPGDPAALVTMVQIYEQMENPLRSLPWLKQSWQRYPESLVVGLSLFKLYLSDKKPELAEKVMRSLLVKHGDNPRLTETVAKLFANSGHTAQAIDVLEKKGREDEWNLSNLLLLADMKARQGKLAESDALYNKVLEQDANSRYAILGLIRLHINQKEYEAASVLAKKLIAVEPDSPASYQVQANIATLAGHPEHAVKSYEQAMQKGGDAQVLAAYVDALMKNNNQEQAVLVTRNWLFAHPAHHRVRLLLAGIYQESKQVDSAIREYLLLENSDAFTKVVLNNLIWLFIDTSDSRLSSYVDKLTALMPDEPEIMDTLGWAYLKLGQKEKAGDYLRKAAVLLKENLSVQYHLAVYLNSMGKQDEAVTLLKAITVEGQDFMERDDALKLLSSIKSGGKPGKK